MPKIYDQNKERNQSSSDTPSGGPTTKMHNRGMMLALAAVLAVIIIIMLYRMARGEEYQVAVIQPHPAAMSSLLQATAAYPDIASTLLRYQTAPSP